MLGVRENPIPTHPVVFTETVKSTFPTDTDHDTSQSPLDNDPSHWGDCIGVGLTTELLVVKMLDDNVGVGTSIVELLEIVSTRQ